MPRMKILLRVFSILTVAALCARVAYSQTAQAKSKCDAILTIEWLDDSEKQPIDNLVVCNDGKLYASHEFTAPAFGTTPPARTKWDYHGQIGKDALSDLRQFLLRGDVSRLPERLDITKGMVSHPTSGTMQVVMTRDGKQQSVIVRVPAYLVCGEELPEAAESVKDLICLFSNLSQQTKNGGDSREGDCGCKSLYEMSAPMAARDSRRP
jgi:hypothetical protein